MTVADTLRAARALVDKPEKWTKDMAARDARGLGVPGASSEAVCWCSETAIYKASGEWHSKAATLFKEAVGLTPDQLIPAWNDRPDRAHSDILAAFDRAIALAEQDVKS